ncbi:dihydrofolate reductase family protein [Microbacterium sp. E-13]|uniref:dihydrofolate reductase family protein n=1 Tax=Microbacterium sp. E-13 TaxID=3404048 RepID=UPI003CF438A5
MRKVVLAMQVSLDGFVATEDGDLAWVFDDFSGELMDSTVEELGGLDTVLMGRHNFLEQREAWATRGGPIAEIMHGVEKVVFSHSLSEPLGWQNSRLATATPAEEIARLKQAPGGSIGIAGGATFARHVIDNDLVDEYRLTVHPVILGRGMSIFTKRVPLSVISTQQFPHDVTVRRFSRIAA